MEVQADCCYLSRLTVTIPIAVEDVVQLRSGYVMICYIF